MGINDNQIDSDFAPNATFKKNIKKGNVLENEINVVLQQTKDSLYSIYVVNTTSKTVSISTQDWHLFLIQEAKNKHGEWKPVEYWQYSTCGNSYQSKNVTPNGILKTESLAYSGSFKTEIRFKLLNNDRIYYSNPIDGFVHLSQFSIPSNIPRYQIIEKVGGSELLEKILFLDPNGMKEYGEKQEAYLAKW